MYLNSLTTFNQGRLEDTPTVDLPHPEGPTTTQPIRGPGLLELQHLANLCFV